MGRPPGSKNKPKPIQAEVRQDQLNITITGELFLQMQAVSVVKDKSVQELVYAGVNSIVDGLTDKERESVEHLIEFGRRIGHKTE